MDDSLFISNSKTRVPLAATFTVLIIFIIESTIYIGRENVLWALFQTVEDKKAALESPARDDVAIIGDSRLFHLRPEAVREALGGDLRVTNYTWPLFGVEGYPYFLHGYLYEKDRPGVFLFSFQPNYIAQPEEKLFLQKNPIVTNRMYAFLPFAPLMSDLLSDERYGVAWDYLHYLFTPPSLKWRDRIREHIKSICSGNGLHDFDAEDHRRVDEYRAEGGFTIYSTQQFTAGEFERDINLYGPYTARKNREVLAQMERFLSETQKLNIAVVLMNAPISESLYRIYEREGVIERYNEVIASWEKEYKNLIVIRPLVAYYKDENFGDMGHVNAKGEARHRKFYTEALRKHRQEILSTFIAVDASGAVQ